MKSDGAAIFGGEIQSSSTDLSNVVELGLPCPLGFQLKRAAAHVRPPKSVTLAMRHFGDMAR